MRGSEQIRAELEALRGKKGTGRKVGALKDDLIEALTREKQEAAISSVSAPGSTDPGPFAIEHDSRESDPFDTAEGRFVQQCCAELDIELRGATTNLAKRIYTQVMMKVRIWRVLRSLYGEIGSGVEWPQFVDLERDPDTGEKIERRPEPAPPTEAVTPEPAAPSAVPGGQTSAGMPVMAGEPSRDEILAQFGGGPAAAIEGAIASRPAVTPVPAPSV